MEQLLISEAQLPSNTTYRSMCKGSEIEVELEAETSSSTTETTTTTQLEIRVKYGCLEKYMLSVRKWILTILESEGPKTVKIQINQKRTMNKR